MEEVYVRGIGMTKFGKFLDLSMKDMARDSVEEVLADAEMESKDIQAIFFANSLAGLNP